MFDVLGTLLGPSLSTATNPADWFVTWTRGGEPTSSGVSVDENTALNYSAAWAATCIISETLASMPLILYKRLKPQGKERASTHTLYSILHEEPNPEMDAVTFWSATMPDVVNWGYGLAEKELALDGKTLLHLWPIPAGRATPKRSSSTTDPGDGIKAGDLYFEVRKEDGTMDRPLPFSRALVIPGRMPNSVGIGKGVIRQARESIGMGLATERYGAQLFGNGARPGGFLTVPPGMPLSEEAKNRLEDGFNRKYKTSPHSVGVLRDGITYTPSFIPPEEAQFLQTRQHNITEIARWYRIPPHLLADLSRATFSNIDSEVLSFLTYSMLPWFTKVEEACTRQLLTKEERQTYFVEFLIDALLRGDPKARAEARQIEFMNGALNLDEWRSGENRNPVPGGMGDAHFVPANLIPLKRALEEPSEQPPSQSGLPPADDKEPEPDRKDKPTDAEQNSAIAQWAALRKKASRSVMAEVVGRMLTKEANAAKRAATKPREFGAWLDTFYSSHRETMQSALRVTVTNYLACTETIADPLGVTEEAVNLHITQSREDLLRASECQPGELVGRVEACVAKWNGRELEVGV
jgi:HK97 family phage portal protein